jgi:hypothetical protein
MLWNSLADPHPTYHFDAYPAVDADPDLYLIQIWMRIRIRLVTLMRIRIQVP